MRDLILVLSKFVVFEHQETNPEDESWGEHYQPRAPGGGSLVPPVQGAPRRV